MALFNRSKNTMKPVSRLPRQTESLIVAALSRGNISLQMGKYLTQDDIESMRKRVQRNK